MDEILKLLNSDIKISDVMKVLANEELNPQHALIIILFALEKCDMSDDERLGLSKISDIILEKLITRNGKYKVIPVVDDEEFASGYFVSSLEYLTPPYTIHEHYYIDNGDTRLTEWYYTGANGLKYRQVRLPEAYRDPGFLLENSMISVRKNNMEKLAKNQKARRNSDENSNIG